MTADKLVSRNVITVALRVLAHVMGDEELRNRFVAMSGIAPEQLARRVEDPDLLAAVTDFISRNEQDLLECAAALHDRPAAIAAVAAALNPAYDGD